MANGEMGVRVRYKVESNPKGYTRAELIGNESILKHEWAGCDKLIIISIREGSEPSIGRRNQTLISVDGHTGGDLSGDDLFKAWALMAYTLLYHVDNTTPSGQLCRQVHETFKAPVIWQDPTNEQIAYNLGYSNPTAFSCEWSQPALVNAFCCGQNDAKKQQPCNFKYNPAKYAIQ